MCDLAEQLRVSHALPAGEGVEPHDFGLGQGRDARRAVAVNPLHVVMLLPRGFDQIAEEGLVVVVEVHVGQQWKRSSAGRQRTVRVNGITWTRAQTLPNPAPCPKRADR